MDVALPAAIALGFITGFKHAFEPDHISAVSTLLHRNPKMSGALRIGLAWGAGHTTMLLVAVLFVGVLRLQVSEHYILYLELLVAAMLLALGGWAIYLAVISLWSSNKSNRVGDSSHDSGKHQAAPDAGRSGWTSYAIGLIHGLAGSGALLLIVAASLTSLSARIFYTAVFGIGSIIGMGIVTAAIAVPFLASRKRPSLYHVLTGLSGALSIVIGLSIIHTVLV